MQLQVTDKFTAPQHPKWKLLTPEEQAEIREWWVEERLKAHGNPRDQRVREMLVKEAYADVEAAKPPFLSSLKEAATPFAKEVLAGVAASGLPVAAVASHILGVGPAGFQRKGGQILRVFEAPRELMWRSFKKLGEGELPPPKAVGKAGAETLSYVGEGGEPVELPEPIEKLPLSSFWTDPTLFGGVAALTRAGVKGLLRPRARIRPLSAEEMRAFNLEKQAEEAARRAALRQTISEVKGEELVRKIGPTPPAPRGPYNRAMIKLTPHFHKEEARKVAEFVARHQDDPLSQRILSTKGSISPEDVTEIEWRIFGRRATQPAPPPPPKKKEAPKTTPPKLEEEELTLDILTQPGELAKKLLKMAD